MWTKLIIALAFVGLVSTGCQTIKDVSTLAGIATGGVEFSAETQQQVRLSLIGLENLYIFTAERVEDAVDAGLLVGADAQLALDADNAAFAVINAARASLATGNFDVSALLAEGKDAVSALAAVLGPLF